MDLLHSLHRASQIGTDLFAKSADNVTIRQAVVMLAIRENTGASQTALVNATGVDRSTLADLVRRIQRKGWATRRRTPADMRAYAVKLTPEGEAALSKAKKAAAVAERELLAQMPNLKHLANGKN